VKFVSNSKDPAVKKWLQKPAKSIGRNQSFLAAKVINKYFGLNEWLLAGIQ
jgi:predicted transcriptional regulator